MTPAPKAARKAKAAKTTVATKKPTAAKKAAAKKPTKVAAKKLSKKPATAEAFATLSQACIAGDLETIQANIEYLCPETFKLEDEAHEVCSSLQTAF